MLGLQQRLSQTLQDRILEVTVQTCNCQYHRTQFAVGKRPSIAGRKQVASPLIDVAVPEIAYDAQSPVQALDQLALRSRRPKRTAVDQRNVHISGNHGSDFITLALKIDTVIQVRHQQDVTRSRSALVVYYLVYDSRSLDDSA